MMAALSRTSNLMTERRNRFKTYSCIAIIVTTGAMLVFLAVSSRHGVYVSKSQFPGRERFKRLPASVTAELAVVSIGLRTVSRDVLEDVADSYYLHNLSIAAEFDGTHCWIFRRLPHLDELDISSPSFDTGLSIIAEHCPRIHTLHCVHTSLPDEELADLFKLSFLRVLTIGSRSLTDQSVVHLSRLKQLEFLDLNGTLLSPEAIDALSEELPDTKIIRPYRPGTL